MQENAEMNNIMTERFGVSGAMLVKTYGNEERELDQFARRAATVRDIGVKSAMLTRIFLSVMGLVGAVGTAAIYWWGGRQVINGAITLGTLTALAALASASTTPHLAHEHSHRRDVRLRQLRAGVRGPRHAEPIQGLRHPVELVEAEGRIEFDDVVFHYPAASTTSVASLEGDFAPQSDELATVLKGVTATIEPGQMVALVGPSGAGKSTMSALLTRLYDVTGGAIRVDGTDVRDISLSSLRDSIGIVAQDPHMFTRRSVRTSATPARRDRRPAAARLSVRAGARRDHATPDGFDTVVGERGYRLSGGEKQRLAIARMLVKNPSIVILDEATSHLDSENEHLVQMALATALADRTSIVIAHRLSTITSADQILVMEQGQIVQRGKHAELVTPGGLYTELYRTLVGSAS